MADVRNIELKNESVERVCLAAMVQFPDLICDLERWQLKPDVFSHSVHKCLYSGIIALANKGPVDPYLLSSHLSSLGITKMNDVSLHDYIEVLTEIPLSKDSFHSFFEELVKYYYSRKADAKCAQMRVDIRRNLEKPFSEVVTEIEKGFSDVSTLQVSNLDSEFVDIFGTAESTIKSIADGEPTGVWSPFKSFNDYYGPFTFGDSYVFAARSKVGKSTLLSYLSTSIVKDNPKVKILICDTEMEARRVQCRNLSSETGVNEFYFRNGGFKNDKNMVSKAEKTFEKWKGLEGRIYHLYAADKPISEIQSIVKRFYSRYIKDDEILIIVYDYIKETGEGAGQDKKEWELVGLKANILKQMASATPRTIVLTSVQLNEEDKVAQSARILWFSSMVALLKKKTPEQLQSHTMEFGTHYLEVLVTRSQGENFEEFVPFQQAGETKYIRNNINLKFENFSIEDKGTYKAMVKKLESSGRQLEIAKPKENKYRKALESAF